jgi:zinc protease
MLTMLISGAALSCAGPRTSATGGPGSGGGHLTSPRGANLPRAIASAPLGSLTIRKWRLDNGLDIITLPDPAARGISYLTVFRVGSRDEDAAAGETGLAHLFEHLMFTGVRAGGQADDFDRQIEEVGGSSNAMTTHDFTSYINELPPEALDRVIRIEADRMINLTLGQKQIANEREVVIQERLGTVEDSVDGLLDEMVWGQAFRSHPYRWPVIGRMEDIKSVTKEKAIAFYRRHYAPNRAIVVVAGRFDERIALELIVAAYAPLPPGTESMTPASAPERAPAMEVRSHVTRPVPADRVVMGYPAPALGDRDRAAADVLNELLVGGPSSRLYRLLVVEREMASSVSGEVAPTADPGLWCLWIQATRGYDASGIEDLVLRAIARVTAEFVPPTELAGAKNRLETAFWHDLASSRGRAEALGQFEVTTGDFRNLIDRGDAYGRVTAEDVARVARTFLAPAARSVVTASPGDRP